VIVVEVTRPTPATTPQQLANIAKTAIACGADALCVRLDSEDTPEGTKDLFAVVQVRFRSALYPTPSLGVPALRLFQPLLKYAVCQAGRERRTIGNECMHKTRIGHSQEACQIVRRVPAMC
jgi:hypothetical protein